MTIGTSGVFGTGNSCFLWRCLQEDTVKVLHGSGPILHEGGPAQAMVLKAISKMVLAASQLQESVT